MVRRRQPDSNKNQDTPTVAPEAPIVRERGNGGHGRTEAPLPESQARGLMRPEASPLDLPTELFTAGLDRRKQNRTALLEWIRTALVDGTDYGRLHIVGKERCPLARSGQAAQCQEPQHWSKPSLFKPGAEKICGMLGVTVHFPSLPAYEQAAVSGQNLSVILLRCELQDSQGRTVAEGIGARRLQQDYGDLNKTLKIAGKSAHIDATLRLAGLSEVFTQDLEDLPPGGAPKTDSGAEDATGEGSTSPPDSDTAALDPYPPGQAPVTISRAQIRYLEKRIQSLGLERERVLSWLKRATKGQRTSFEELTPELYDRLLPKLEQWANPNNGKKTNGPKRNGNGNNGDRNGNGNKSGNGNGRKSAGAAPKNDTAPKTPNGRSPVRKR
jgi:hypothetical protein